MLKDKLLYLHLRLQVLLLLKAALRHNKHKIVSNHETREIE
jgi:hypothetical protein